MLCVERCWGKGRKGMNEMSSLSKKTLLQDEVCRPVSLPGIGPVLPGNPVNIWMDGWLNGWLNEWVNE